MNSKKKLKIPKNKWLKNYFDASKLKDIDIVIELIGGSDGPAKKLVFNSIKNKKHVVTANKSLISKHGNELAKLAEKNKVNLEFEAAVGGGIPIIRVIKEALITNKIDKIYGILNGTSNFILSQMSETNLNFNDVLNNAKKLGYAEANPKSDLNGDDAKSKIQILSSLAFNSFIIKSDISVEGIERVDQVDILNAKILGYKIKHLAIAEIKNNKLIQRGSSMYGKKILILVILMEFLNAVIIEGYPIGKFTIQGESRSRSNNFSISFGYMLYIKGKCKITFFYIE